MVLWFLLVFKLLAFSYKSLYLSEFVRQLWGLFVNKFKFLLYNRGDICQISPWYFTIIDKKHECISKTLKIIPSTMTIPFHCSYWACEGWTLELCFALLKVYSVQILILIYKFKVYHFYLSVFYPKKIKIDIFVDKVCFCM